MSRVRLRASSGLCCCILCLGAAAALLTFPIHFAGATTSHRYRVLLIHEAGSRQHADADASPLYASIVVDGNSGQVLEAVNADAPRHPASLTKIMTLYLLFERLDAGRIRLDTQIRVSDHAAQQAPTKLGLKPGHTITVDDAIKGVVTKSANDAAVAIAEALGGGEEEFAALMTQKARALGMSRTTYVNASGLPDDDQITTARDQALLGRTIQDRFPRYYRYFSIEEFVYHGAAMRNHNHLLGEVGGVDGIKTGYTRASGFNLVTSVHRDGHYIVGVVLGGRSAGERDARMRELIANHIKEAAVRRTAPPIGEIAETRIEPAPAVVSRPLPQPPQQTLPQTWPQPAQQLPQQAAQQSLSQLAPRPDRTQAPAENSPAPVGSSEPIHPLMVRTITYRTAPVPASSFAPPTGTLTQSAPSAAQSMPTPTAETAPVAEEPSRIVVASTGPAPVVPARVESQKTTAEMVERSQPQVHARGGWLIQVGAFEGEDEARQHLSAAQTKVPGVLRAAEPFTERVQRGDKSLYRARFAGLDRAAAEEACKLLKRSAIDCMALKN